MLLSPPAGEYHATLDQSSPRTRHRPLQIGTGQCKIDDRVQPLQAVTFGRELPQPLVDIKKSCLTPHFRPPAQTRLIESQIGQNREVLRGLQLVPRLWEVLRPG